jgi:hypothetical protein
MKKYLFFFIAPLPLAAAAQKTADQVLLKNGQTVAGCIYKMENGNIYLVKTADSVILNTTDIKSIRFGNTGNHQHPVPPAPPAPAAGTPKQGDENPVTQHRTFSSFTEMSEQETMTKNTDTEKATVVFRCTMCGGNGNLSVAGENGKNKTTAVYTFAMENDRHFFSHRLQLQPGEYTWQYHDSRNNASKGKFVVKKGEEKKIFLFEQE